MRNQRLLETKNALNIQSLKHLALQIGIKEDEISDIALNIKKHYVISEIKQTKSDGEVKVREIYHPSKQLKKLLKAINTYLLKKIKLSDVVHGARKKHSILTNAESHVGKRFLLGFDIKNCFPSIKPYNVFNMFRRLKCSPEIAKCLTRICTADDHVPQGYNTSPAIANLVLMPLTERLRCLAKKHGKSFSTFIDDITFSGNSNPEKYKKTIEKIINECGFKLKTKKTKPREKTQQQKVTGVVVNVKPNIDKKTFQKLKKIIHICQKFGASAFIGKIKNKKGEIIDTSDKLRNYLSGRINYVNQLNPTRAQKLREKFNGIIW